MRVKQAAAHPFKECITQRDVQLDAARVQGVRELSSLHIRKGSVTRLLHSISCLGQVKPFMEEALAGQKGLMGAIAHS